MNKSVGEEFIEAKEKFGNRNFRVYNSTSSNIGKIIQKEQNKKNKKSKDNIFIKKRKRPPVLASLKGLKKVVALKNKLLKTLDKNMFLMIGGIMLAAGALLAASKGGFGETEGSYEDGSGLSSGRLSQKGRERLIADEGGHRLTAYQDSKGVWTIGVGHTGKVDGVAIHKGMTISREKSEQLFENDVKRFEKMVNDAVKVPISQNMFDALVNFTYVNGHIKGTKLLERLNKGDYRGAQQELSIEPIHETRMKRLRQSFGQDITSDNKLKEPTIYTGKAAQAVHTGSKIGNAYKQNNNVKIPKQMKEFLEQSGVHGTITSGIRENEPRTRSSHWSGNKADIGLGNVSYENIIKTSIELMSHPAIVHIAYEGLGQKGNNQESDRISKSIVNEIKRRRPDLAKRMTNNEDEAWNTDKFIVYHWGWRTRASGPHIDFLINPNRLNNNLSYNKNININKNTQKMKNNINQTNTKQVTTRQNATKQTPNNIRTQKTSNINTGNNRMVTGSKLPSHKATQQNTGKKKGL